MVGNDIVDLNLAQRNAWRQKRFLDKVLVPSEQEALKNSSDPARLLWVLWSMKESAYKLHFRKRLKRALNPTRFTCFLEGDIEPGFEGELRGRVEVGEQVYRTNSKIFKNYVHTTATQNTSRALMAIDEVTAESSNEIRQKTIHNLVRSFSYANGLDSLQLNFIKDKNGLPFLTHEPTGHSHACSISHHGRYGAFAIAW